MSLLMDLSLHLAGLGARLAIYTIEAQAKDVMAKNSEKPECGKLISHHLHMRLVRFRENHGRDSMQMKIHYRIGMSYE